jgi:ligand-binding sensor domain-containing protein
MMRKLLITLFSIVTLTSAGQSHFYTSERLSSNQITQICQDKEGYIWIGTEYGLNKYDGYRFTNYLHDKENPNSVSSNVMIPEITLPRNWTVMQRATITILVISTSMKRGVSGNLDMEMSSYVVSRMAEWKNSSRPMVQ